MSLNSRQEIFYQIHWYFILQSNYYVSIRLTEHFLFNWNFNNEQQDILFQIKTFSFFWSSTNYFFVAENFMKFFDGQKMLSGTKFWCFTKCLFDHKSKPFSFLLVFFVQPHSYILHNPSQQWHFSLNSTAPSS